MNISLTHTFTKLVFILLLGWALAGCNTGGGNAQEGAEDQTEAVAAGDETQSEDDEKAQRPSPPREVAGEVGGAQVKINYSSPGVKGRVVWGELVPFDQVWRTGANEATTFEVDKEVSVNGQSLPAGRYALFTIPTQGDWTLIFNSVPDQWGAYEYDESKDVLRVAATPGMVEENQERLEFFLNVDGEVTLAWEKLRLPFSVVAVQ